MSADSYIDLMHKYHALTAELSRLRRIDTAAREYCAHLQADRTQHWHARNQALLDALAAEVEKTYA